MNRGSRWGGKIDAGVRGMRLPVEDAAPAEIAAGGHAIERNAKTAPPQSLRRCAVKNGMQTVALLLGARNLLRIGLDELFFHAQVFSGEVAFFYGYVRSAIHRLGLPRLHRDFQRILAGGFFKVDAEQRPPYGSALAYPPESHIARIPFSLYLEERGRTVHFRQQQTSLRGLRRA